MSDLVLGRLERADISGGGWWRGDKKTGENEIYTIITRNSLENECLVQTIYDEV